MRARRIISLLILLDTASAGAQEMMFNVDPLSTASFTEAYGAAVAAEGEYLNSAKKIYDKYISAEAGAAIILASEWERRKALSDLGFWTSASENYYYQRIYHIVSSGIIPMTLKIATKCVREPHKALYWGSYFYDVLGETKKLCMEFESVVTNSRITFGDIAWIEINEHFAPYVTLADVGNGSIREGLEQMAERLSGFTKEDMKDAFSSLKGNIGTLASNFGRSLKDEMMNRFSEVITGMTQDMFDVRERFRLLIGDGDNIVKEFKLDQAKLFEWRSDIANLKMQISAGGPNIEDLRRQYFEQLAMYEDAMSAFDRMKSKFDSDLKAIGGSLTNIVTDAEHYFDAFTSLSPEDILDRIFQIAKYDMASYISDYLLNTTSEYYTQMWSIERRVVGHDVLIDYVPPRPPEDNLGHWTTAFESVTKDNWGHQTGQQAVFDYDRALSSSFARSGANEFFPFPSTSGSRVYKNADGVTHTHTLTTRLEQIKGDYTNQSDFFSGKPGTYSCYYYYAYSIRVTDDYDFREVRMSKILDTYSMDVPSFTNYMNTALNEYNKNDSGYVYTLVKGEPQPYPAPDRAKYEGVDKAIIKARKLDTADMAAGSTTYTCPGDKYPLTHSVYECSMNSGDSWYPRGAEIQDKIYELRMEMEHLATYIDQLQRQEESLKAQLASASGSSAASIRSSLETLRQRLADARRQFAEDSDAIDRLTAGLDQLMNEASDPADNYRIPAIMADVKKEFDLKWIDGGHWEDFTFVRYASIIGDDSQVRFEATVCLRENEIRILGVQLRESRIGIDWSLKQETVTESIVNEVDLTGIDESERGKLVMDAFSAAAQEFPDCQIVVEYVKADGVDDKDTEDVYHLLWAGDRLEIARKTEARLIAIYADLISLDRMMTIRMSVLDMLSSGVKVNVNAGHGDIAGRCLERWSMAADSVHVSHSILSK